MSRSVRAIVLTVPPSMNTNQVRNRWSNATLKQQWQRTFEGHLLAVGLPRPIPAEGPVQVNVVLRFDVKRRRDVENFRPLLSKALGDALVNGRWLTDDTAADWRLTLTIDPELGAPTTTITLSWDEALEAAA